MNAGLKRTETFVLNTKYLNYFTDLSDDAARWSLLNAIFQYVKNGNTPALSKDVAIYFRVIQLDLDISLANYHATCERNRISAKSAKKNRDQSGRFQAANRQNSEEPDDDA